MPKSRNVRKKKKKAKNRSSGSGSAGGGGGSGGGLSSMRSTMKRAVGQEDAKTSGGQPQGSSKLWSNVLTAVLLIATLAVLYWKFLR